uniref:Cardiotrophin 1 n=1 Tax=Rousettus aegyptiacus TaxID=9407 RepID=A0A7J8EXY5_ROUAE|nr:cardiotrophin 1 [Rousettus aegyptiacus]
MSQREGSLEDPQADSSISPIPHLEAKIHQTHRLARLLTKYAEQLLQEYVSGDGCGGARGLRNGEVQITGVLDHSFLNLISQLQKLVLQKCLVTCPWPHIGGHISVLQMPLHPPQLGGSLLGTLRQRQPESEGNSGLGVRKPRF